MSSRFISALALLALCTTVSWAGDASCPQLSPGVLPLSPDGKLVVTADQIDGASGSLANLLGSVKVRLGEREITSESLQYDDTSRIVTANTPFQFRNDDYVILSRSGSYDLNREAGVFNRSEFTLVSRGARGKAEEMAVEKTGHAQLTKITYTTCAPGRDSWSLTAGQLDLNQETGIGTARNATLRLGVVPVLYTPYLRFPIDGERHSGFLFPTFGSNTRTGVDARLPYYLNLAPNYDATLTPRFMSDRGQQLAVGGRYLFPRSTGTVNLEYLPSDAQFDNRSRSFGELQHNALVNQRISLAVHYAEASDPNYLEDLSFTPGLSSNPYLESSARLVYQAPSSYTLQALVQKFQPLAGTLAVDDPYRRVPELRFDGVTRNDFLNSRLGLSAQATNFAKAGAVEGTRQVLRPSINWTRDTGSYYTGAQGDFHYTRYQLRDENAQQLDDRQRSLPIFSGDAGLRFARTGDNGGLQLLEPRLFYLYVPYRDQDGLPVFDTGQPDYDFPQLFARNRFLGEDRIADANQLTTAVTYRALDPKLGSTRFTASLGQIYRFDPSRVTVPGLAAPDAGSSDYLASTELRLNPKFSTTALVQVSPDTGKFSRTSFGLRYRDGRYRGDIGYRYRSGLLEQFDVSGALPIGNAFKAAARVRYSAREDRLLDTLMGIEYETCCYSVQTAYRRYLVNSSGDIDSGIFFQVELKGLSRLGTGFEELLTGDDRPLGDD
ncbi:MAG: LPS-assembly protein LptD [Stagnimonas sp.]|nr:LPS-assembly protein LptD [Stagnimonas sp.]